MRQKYGRIQKGETKRRYNSGSLGVNGGDGSGSVVKQINVVHLNVEGSVDGSGELPLPCGARSGGPN